QAAGTVHEIDVRSDVYALGSILYECVTHGQTPFQGSTREILHQIHFTAPRAPSVAAENVPWELDAICLKKLEKDGNDRYQSAVELRLDVDRYLNGVPIGASRATAAYRLRKWITRNKRKAAGILATAGVVLALSASLVGRSIVAESQRRSAIETAARDGWERF